MYKVKTEPALGEFLLWDRGTKVSVKNDWWNIKFSLHEECNRCKKIIAKPTCW